jgi:hypothetical protein
MSSALIGCTGFVGGTLARHEPFDLLINRANLASLEGLNLTRLVCAGLPASKWIANREPDADRANMERLCRTLGTVSAKSVTLISTIDVYPNTTSADEDYDCSVLPNHPYGTHRLAFERFVRGRFPHAHIVRLAALFGTGLRKNVLYDLLHDNALDVINPDSRFQWYPLIRLPQDLQTIQAMRLALVNLFTEPIATREILTRFFPGKRVGRRASPQIEYGLRTRYDTLFGGGGGYSLGRAAVLDEMARFIETERNSL